jgi:hypothetical protein
MSVESEEIAFVETKQEEKGSTSFQFRWVYLPGLALPVSQLHMKVKLMKLGPSDDIVEHPESELVFLSNRVQAHAEFATKGPHPDHSLELPVM